MNYIAEINAFYSWLMENPISGNTQALWHRLMAYCNVFGWKSEFSISNIRLIDELDISKSEFIRIRNTLHQKGLINYKKGTANKCGIYQIVSFECQNQANCSTAHSTTSNTISSTTSSTSSSTENEPQTAPQSAPLNKQNKTKQNKINIKENNKKKIFKKPTVEEVKAYCDEKGYNIDPKGFVDYYEAMEWKDVKGTPVKNWKGKVVTWNNNSNNKKSSEPKKECYDDPKKYEGKGWGC